MIESPQTLESPQIVGPTAGGLVASVRAVGLARMSPESTATFRRGPGPIPEGWKPIAPTFLKTSDEQTVAAVAAVLAAMEGQGVDRAAFSGWGVVAASRYLGRSQLVLALQRFRDEGVWGVSPHLIPHFALHSPAGTLSLALGAHGPNLGVGGGPGSAMEGALTALTWLSEGRLPGVWLVLTGYDPELVPGPKGEPTTASGCQALALALVPEGADHADRPRLRVVSASGDEAPGPLDLVELHARWVADSEGESANLHGPRTLAVAPGAGLRLEWDSADDETMRGAW